MVGFEGEGGVQVTAQVFDVSKFIKTGDLWCVHRCVFACVLARARAKVGGENKYLPSLGFIGSNRIEDMQAEGSRPKSKHSRQCS